MSDPFKLSVSKTKTFLGCKKQYEYNYILKLPQKEQSYHILGKFCHSVLEHFHNQYIDGSLFPYNVVMGESYKSALAEYKDKMTVDMKKECFQIIDSYLQELTKEKNAGKKLNVLACEKSFDFPLTENITIRGAIDKISLDDDNVLNVSDYKSTKNKKYLKDDYFQLLTYAFVLLTEDSNIEKVRASYILLRHNCEKITTEFNKEEILAVKQKYIDYANQMLSEKDFTANPTILCNWCSYQDICESAKPMLFPDNPNVYGEVSW